MVCACALQFTSGTYLILKLHKAHINIRFYHKNLSGPQCPRALRHEHTGAGGEHRPNNNLKLSIIKSFYYVDPITRQIAGSSHLSSLGPDQRLRPLHRVDLILLVWHHLHFERF